MEAEARTNDEIREDEEREDKKKRCQNLVLMYIFRGSRERESENHLSRIGIQKPREQKIEQRVPNVSKFQRDVRK